jgi:isocitrate/isopropylmalate dehydrogenase
VLDAARIVLDKIKLDAEYIRGDIMPDRCAQLVGSLGFAAFGNAGDKVAVFEPTHGSALKCAEQYKVNPVATLLSAKMMMDWLGETDKGAAPERAIAKVTKDGKVRTYDLGGSMTLEMAEAVASCL